MADTHASRRVDSRRPSPQEVVRDATELISSLRKSSAEWSDVLRRNMRQNPYGALCIAAGVGYVLAGGLAPSTVRLAVGTGWRIAGTVLLHELLASTQTTNDQES